MITEVQDVSDLHFPYLFRPRHGRICDSPSDDRTDVFSVVYFCTRRDGHGGRHSASFDGMQIGFVWGSK